jgi:hypothetical protein
MTSSISVVITQGSATVGGCHRQRRPFLGTLSSQVATKPVLGNLFDWIRGQRVSSSNRSVGCSQHG